MKLKISQVCKAISTINIPRTTYHQRADVPIKLPINEATVPRAVKVIAEPRANVRESLNAFFVSFCPVPPTNPITNGMLDKEQGVTDVRIPAIRARMGASHMLSLIKSESCSRIASII